MPVTRVKNIMYRIALPLIAPSAAHSLFDYNGHEVQSKKAYEKLIRKHHILGSACIISNGKDTARIYSSTEDPKHPADQDTFFRVASITKMAVSLVTLKLCEEGLLTLDGPACDYLPDAQDIPSLKGVTLRMILSHTSGLDDPEDLEKDLYAKRTFREVLMKDHVRVHEPGAAFLYSNLAFGLLGSMMEYVTGQDVETVFRKKLFQPLGMRATLDPTTLPYEKIMPISRVLPYHPGQDTIIIPLRRTPVTDADPLLHYGYTAGGLYADAESIRILLDTVSHEAKGYLSPELGCEIAKKQSAYGTDAPGLDYGIGLFIITDPSLSSKRILGHQGFAYGCVDGAFYDEETGNVLIILDGGCSELRMGRLGAGNDDLLHWAFRKELPLWK